MPSGVAIKGRNAERTRSSNRQAVLGRIQSAGQMGRAEIARALGLSTQAVSNIIAELQSEGLLRQSGTRSGGRGLPAVLYSLNPEGGYAMGVEVRPDALFAALLDLNGTPINTRRQALSAPDPEQVSALARQFRVEMMDKSGAGPERLLGVGVVMPGPFGETGLSGLGSDLPGWQVVDPQVLFQEAMGLPVEVSNDANAAAMAERIGGVAQGLSTYAYLYFGAGLGLGLIDQGRLVSGAFGNAGEIGHVPVTLGDWTAPLESLLSRVSVQRHLLHRGPMDVSTLDALFEAEDRDLYVWMDMASGALAQAMMLIENLFDPQTVILGGAMPTAILKHLVARTRLPRRSVSNRPDNTIPRLQCGTAGPMTATLGAASLILNRAFSPQVAAL